MNKLIKDYLQYMETIKGKSNNTSKIYGCDLNLFFDFLKKQFKVTDVDKDILKRIDLKDLHKFLNYLDKERHNSAATRSHKVACLKSFFAYLKLDHNPTLELESPKIGERIPKFMNVDECKQLLESIDGENKERDVAIITMFLNCGLRLNELANIDLKHISNNELTVIGKGDKERMIPLNQMCIDAINNYLNVRNSSCNALFVVENKRISKRGIQYTVKKYIEKAGLDEKISVHKLRHTAATLMYKNGVDIRTLQELLGHKSISTTEIYTHVGTEQLRNAVNSNPLNV